MGEEEKNNCTLSFASIWGVSLSMGKRRIHEHRLRKEKHLLVEHEYIYMEPSIQAEVGRGRGMGGRGGGKERWGGRERWEGVKRRRPTPKQNDNYPRWQYAIRFLIAIETVKCKNSV